MLKFLVKAGKIAQATADQISAWPHSGLGVYNGSVIAKNDAAAIERVAQYMLRNPFALSKMTYNRLLQPPGLMGFGQCAASFPFTAAASRWRVSNAE